MQQKGHQAPGSSRRVGGGQARRRRAGRPMAPARGWLLKIWAGLFAWPLFLALVRGSFREVLAYSWQSGSSMSAAGRSSEAAVSRR